MSNLNVIQTQKVLLNIVRIEKLSTTKPSWFFLNEYHTNQEGFNEVCCEI